MEIKLLGAGLVLVVGFLSGFFMACMLVSTKIKTLESQADYWRKKFTAVMRDSENSSDDGK